MPLVSLLYRCPRCGHDPLEGEKDEARCPECRIFFSRGRDRGRIEILDEAGDKWEVASHELSAAVEAAGWSTPGAQAGSEGWSHQANAEMRYASHEVPFHFHGQLLGFAEVFGDPTAGVLELTGEELTFQVEEDAGGGDSHRWLLLEIRAIQTSSSAVQFATKDGSLVQFRFQEDSTRRWETLLREALRTRYREEGLGEIVEYQPRIVAEP